MKKNQPDILSRPEVQEMIQDTLVTLLREACEPVSIPAQRERELRNAGIIRSVPVETAFANVDATEAKHPAPPAGVDPSVQRARISEIRKHLDAARKEHEDSLQRFNHTVPTSDQFGMIVDELHAATIRLIEARHDFLVACQHV